MWLGCALFAGALTISAKSEDASRVLAKIEEVRLVHKNETFVLEVHGIKPSPCHRVQAKRLRTRDGMIQLQVFARPNAQLCVQVLAPFVLQIRIQKPIKRVQVNGRWFSLSR